MRLHAFERQVRNGLKMRKVKIHQPIPSMLDIICTPDHEIDLTVWQGVESQRGSSKDIPHPQATENWVIDPETSLLVQTPPTGVDLEGCVVVYANHGHDEVLADWKFFSNLPDKPYWRVCALRLNKRRGAKMVLTKDLAMQIIALINDLRHDGKTEGGYVSVRSL